MAKSVDSAAEVQLLEGLRAGEPAAYRQLVELNSANVYSVALKLLGNEQESGRCVTGNLLECL